MRGNPFCDNFIFCGAPIKHLKKKKDKISLVQDQCPGSSIWFLGFAKEKKVTPIIVVFKCLFNFHTFTFAILNFGIIYWINIGNCPPLNCSCTVLFLLVSTLTLFSTNILDVLPKNDQMFSMFYCGRLKHRYFLKRRQNYVTLFLWMSNIHY